MKMITYNTNNSGGDWWLSDKDWTSLEKAGWKVKWLEDRFLGALATEASKEFKNVEDAKEEFAKVTGQDPEANGCDSCGEPHSFWEK